MSIASKAEVWDVDDATYFADYSKVSNSMAKVADESMAEYGGLFVLDTAPDEVRKKYDFSYEIQLGRLLHRMVELPKDWRDDVLEYTETKGIDTVAFRKFSAENPGRLIFTPQQIFDAQQMAASILQDDKAARLLGGGQSERALKWVCESTGLERKCKIDRLPDFEVISDLKTTSLSLRQWEKGMWDSHYPHQADWYQEGVHAVYGKFLPFAFVVVRSKWPYECQVVELDSEYLELAHDRNLDTLYDLKTRYEMHAAGDPMAWAHRNAGEVRKVFKPYFLK